MLLFICPVDKDLNWNIVCWRHQNCWALTNVECNWHSNSWVLSIFLPFEKPSLERVYEIDSLQMLSVRRLGKVTTRWKSWTFHHLGYQKQGHGVFKKIQYLKIISQEKIWIAYHLCWKNLCYLLQRNSWIVDSCLQSFLPFCLLYGSDGWERTRYKTRYEIKEIKIESDTRMNNLIARMCGWRGFMNFTDRISGQ